MKPLLLMAFCLLTVAGCKEKSKSDTQDIKSEKSKQVYMDLKSKRYNALLKIPDSLRTPEEKLLVKSLSDVMLNGVVVENNQIVLKMSKKECLAKGMTEKTYAELETSIKDNNHFYDSTENKQVGVIVEDLHHFLRLEKGNGVSAQ